MRTLFTILLAGLAVACFSTPTTNADHHRKLKMRIAVAPLDWGDRDSLGTVTIPPEIKNAIDEKLVKKLVDTGDFVVLERGALQSIQTEKAIKAESSGKSQAGKATPAQALIKARVTDFELQNHGTGATLTLGNVSLGGSLSHATVGVNVRIFDVDSSEMIASETAKRSVTSNSVQLSGNIHSVFSAVQNFDNSPIGEATTKALDAATDKIVKALEKQQWSARVADWDAQAKEITITAGAENGIAVGDEFEVSRLAKVVKDPETGEVLGKKTTYLGRVRVTSVDKRFCTAVPVEGTDFAAGDLVNEVQQPTHPTRD
jgi:curli biogenesis system outer membrane secretion channel CsgG